MMKNKIPSEGLRLGRDSGSILCDTLKKVAFSDSLGGIKKTYQFSFGSIYSLEYDSVHIHAFHREGCYRRLA